MVSSSTTERDELSLHAVDERRLEHEIVRLAMARTGARNGGLFLWDDDEEGLAIRFHVVGGLTVDLPDAVIRRREDGRPNGIAMWCFDHDAPYLAADTREDPEYAPYYLDVRSLLAVPIRYQHRPIGVLTVSSLEPGAFDAGHLDALAEVAGSAAMFLRRAQLYRATRRGETRPFLIKGLSPEWLEVERRIEHVADTDAPVLIQGESGTGKELVAHAIHFNSRRSDRPFVVVNCAALPEAMLESILFGHVRGAFTGASADKVGEFQKADGGTLFLDELGELPIALQAKVLRAVEYGEAQPLGSNQPPKRVDVRLIAATHRDLAAAVRERRFRDDLYYRLSVMTMELPPLRRYKDGNLEVLANVFLRDAARRHGRPAPRIGAEAMARLSAYDYPGNVRELKNAIEHAVIMADGTTIVPTDLPRALLGDEPEPDAPAPAPRRSLAELREEWLAPLERRYLQELLTECGGRVREAAACAGVNHVTMYRLLRKRGVEVRRVVRTR